MVKTNSILIGVVVVGLIAWVVMKNKTPPAVQAAGEPMLAPQTLSGGSSVVMADASAMPDPSADVMLYAGGTPNFYDNPRGIPAIRDTLPTLN